MAAEALAALQKATTEAERRAALLQAMPFNTDAHPEVKQAFEAERRRQHRMGLLAANLTAEVAISRQNSHHERMGMLMEAHTRRSLGLDASVLQQAMKNTCKDFRCSDCSSENGSYRAVCLSFMFNCLAIRVQTRLQFDAANGYRIEPAVTQFMQRFVADPQRVWLDEQKYFRALPDILDLMYTNVVLPTAVNKNGKREAKEYHWHKDSIRKIVESIGRCEQSAST